MVSTIAEFNKELRFEVTVSVNPVSSRMALCSLLGSAFSAVSIGLSHVVPAVAAIVPCWGWTDTLGRIIRPGSGDQEQEDAGS